MVTGGDDAQDPTPDSSPEAGSGQLPRKVRPGSLLIASTDLIEPTFRRSVIYMMEHNAAGSLGVVINQMSQAAGHNLLPQWTDLASSPRALFVGGPVKRDAALCLGVLKPGMSDDEELGVRPVDGRVVLIDLDADPEALADRLEGLRIFAGYAGWGPGQLDGELADGSWLVASALPADLLAPPAADLWFSVLRRQPWPLGLLATHPIDVLRN